MKAVIVAHGDVDPRDREVAASADVVIAADGGALALERWGIAPGVVVGDLDSLGAERAERLRSGGAEIHAFPAAKDESDLELAVRAAIDRGAGEIVLLGIFGGERLDHGLANAMLLADPVYRGLDMRAAFGTTTVRALHAGGVHEIDAPAGATVTLLPVRGDATGVRAKGLRYALDGDTLRFGRARGLSNIVEAVPASVALGTGVLLVIEISDGGS